ncbi:LpqB family beta-propeller domain-containing protein [Micromonospora auratinigra]|uniref:Sporulation and spore germination n=2 Tax=Micromonospora auratinigra TaxID=261654 RepID=A0A1A9A7U0_9ACTN|nr:LpqB family beta-propeller domain-containing protein [Micromonospora auratinigra]SBT52272.1 Sporulation and spore germination [Micromonospora auratinigra]
MRRRLLALLLGGLMIPAGVAGCGIPRETEVQVDGAGPAAEPGSQNGSGARPPSPTDTSEPGQFVRNYLEAAAAGERDQAYARVKAFIAPDKRDAVLRERPQSSEIEMTVVRLRELPEVTPPNNDRTSKVTVKVQQVGVLRSDGTLAPPVATDTTYVFELRPVRDGRPELLIYGLPNVLLVTDQAVRRYYGAHTIYFWNSDGTRLVPDQRYLPSSVPAQRRITEVVKWLTTGPPDWLAGGVSKLPDGTQVINNATGSDGRWEVNLSMTSANDDKLARLATQLAWSLPPEVTGRLDLKIQNQKRLTVDLKQERDKPAYPAGGSPLRFSVYDGVVRPLAFVGEPIGSVPIEAAKNRNVVSAALSRSGDQVLAALVVTRPDRTQALRVGSGPDPVTVFNDSARPYAAIGRPTWIRSLDPDHPAGLVAADGRLYRFDVRAGMVAVSLNPAGRVTAVAGSLEGHRIALVIGGVLYVASVSVEGGVVTLGQPRRLTTGLTDITAVDWIAENELVFAGNDADRRPAIFQVTVDGAQETALKRDIGAAVTQLSGYPGGAVGALSSFSFMYEANRAAYWNQFDIIKREQVQGAPTPGSGGKAVNPTAPFFYY